MRKFFLLPKRKAKAVFNAIDKVIEIVTERHAQLQGYLEVSDLSEDEKDRVTDNQNYLDNIFREAENLREYITDLIAEKDVKSPSEKVEEAANKVYLSAAPKLDDGQVRDLKDDISFMTSQKGSID